MDVSAQGCFPDPSFSTDSFGTYPSGSMVMDCGGLSSSKTIIGLLDTVLNIEITPGSPLEATMYHDAMRITNVDSLPSGLELQTDVINSATEESPYGTWINTGIVPQMEAFVGCISVVGQQADWDAASVGGPNNDGVYNITLHIDIRIAGTNPDLSSIIPNGSWISAVPANLGGGLITLNLELRVNETGCVSGSLFVFPEVSADNASTPACDGEATVVVYNGTPPYSYLYSNGETTQSVTDLCSGVYSVQVEDALGAQTVAEFAIASSENVYSNVGGNIQNGTDSLFTSFYYCDLDYTLPLDSFSITNAITSGPDTCIVTWLAWQQGVPFTLTTYYPFLGPEPTVFSLILWCENGRSEPGMIQLYEFLDLSVGINEETTQIDFMIQPNPSAGIFNLLLPDIKPVSIEVLDIKGALIGSFKTSGRSNYSLDLEHMPDGVYFIQLQNEEGVGYKRIIKQ